MTTTISSFDRALLASLCSLSSAETGIIVFYTGPSIPDYATEMLRHPAPSVGHPVNDRVGLVLQEALEANPSVHDGAIMCGRLSCGDVYRITGWSYRLYPPPCHGVLIPNKGSAFNSGLAMSAVTTVDRVLYWSSGTGSCFEAGSILAPANK